MHTLALPARIYTPRQIADSLGINESTVYKLIRKGCPHNTRERRFGKVRPELLLDPSEVRLFRLYQGRKKTNHWTSEGRDRRPGTIYALRCPKTRQIRYIGKTGKAVEQRLAGHLAEAKKLSHRPVLRWIRKLQRDGLSPTLEVLQECLPGMIDAAEQEWIAKGKAKGWKLLNVTDGGEPGSEWTPERRAEHSRKCGEINRRLAKTDAWIEGQANRYGMTLEEFKAKREEKRTRHQWNVMLNKYYIALGKWRRANGWKKGKKKRERKYPPRAIRIAGDVAYIPLTKGQTAIIDASDVPLVERYLWAAQWHRTAYRAKRTINGKGGASELLQWRIMGRRNGQMVVFRNGNTLDCRRCNLAIVEQHSCRPCQLSISA